MRQAKTSAGPKEVLLLCGCESQMCMGQERLALKIRYSLAGQDTWLSPERPGLESRWRNLVVSCTAKLLGYCWLAGTSQLPEAAADLKLSG